MSQPKQLIIRVTEDGVIITHTGLKNHELVGLCEMARVNFISEALGPKGTNDKPDPAQDEKIATVDIKFNYKGNDYHFIITPTAPDEWATVTTKEGEQFDIHYCEDYNEVCVYKVDDVSKHSIHSQPIK